MKWKNAFYSCYLGSLIIIAHFFSLFSSTHACKFPKEWHGEWFDSDQKTSITINENSFGAKGSCYNSDRSPYYLMEQKSSGQTFYQCLLILLNQENVIQFRETWAEQFDTPPTSSICSELDVNNPLHYLFRVDAKPTACPFINPPFSFYYTKGESRACDNPPSKISACADNSKLLLHYSACTDIQGSESYLEELTCLGTWRIGSSAYLVAKVHDRNEPNFYDSGKYKCYLYENITDPKDNKVVGYKIAQSEASCSGLSSINDGATMMTLRREVQRHVNCKFPSWIVEQKKWRALNAPIEYTFSSSNATKVSSGRESTVVCHSIEASENLKHSFIVVKVMTGCDVSYKCMLFQRRDPHIMEIQEASQGEDNYIDTCHDSKFDPSTLPLVTYVTENLPPRKCPLLPKLVSVPEVKTCKEEVYHQVSIGCGPKPEKVEFKQPDQCQNHTAVEFMCHGHWEAKRINSSEVVGYILGTPLRTDKDKYICFSYTKKNEVYSLRATTPTCYESRALFTFQLKSNGHCQAVETRSGNDIDGDGESWESANKSATLVISALHFVIAYLLSIHIR
ncbi:uncharacterized protein [Bemisia tabaci]|uniref:uncharacterized protein isoform X2 n=1 Tax=Bemisia tabaci TaxID=7038 RepID=UPI0008F9DA1A|nr:PREDICTED: uncharacterized protein LOC109038343 isoform X2 [Bemisia tabaci]